MQGVHEFQFIQYMMAMQGVNLQKVLLEQNRSSSLPSNVDELTQCGPENINRLFNQYSNNLKVFSNIVQIPHSHSLFDQKDQAA